MKSVTINERAAANAMEFVVGPQARMVIENLYGLINSAMNDAYAEGVQDTMSLTSEEGRLMSYRAGYNDGIEIATGGEQPDLSYVEVGDRYEEDFEDQHDSGDETPEIPDEVHSVDELPPMQEQFVRDPATGNWVERTLRSPRSTNPFAWSPGPADAALEQALGSDSAPG